MPLQIGITGGIGSGKSLICKIFQCLCVPVYDADSRAKYIMTTDGILVSQIKKEFGDLSFFSDGSLNREHIGSLTFNDPDRLSTLNKMVHPRVGEDYQHWVESHQESHYVIKEAALLFESNSYKALDKIIVVQAPESLRVKRVLGRDKHRNESQVYDIIARQMPEQKKIELADYIICNDEQHMVIPQVVKLHEEFNRIGIND